MDDTQKRREYDRRFCKKVWEEFPLIAHIAVSLLVGAFVLGGVYLKFEDHTDVLAKHDSAINQMVANISETNEKLGRIDQKLEDLVNFTRARNGGR